MTERSEAHSGCPSRSQMRTSTSARIGSPVARPSVFERLAGWSYRRRWLGARGVGRWPWPASPPARRCVGSDYRNDFSLPGYAVPAGARPAAARTAPARAGATVQIVVQDPAGLADRRSGRGCEAMLGERRAACRTSSTSAARTTTRRRCPRDGTIGVRHGHPGRRPRGGAGCEDVRRLIDVARAAAGDGLRVELGGDAVRDAEEGEGGAAEGVGMLAALVILVLLFGSLLAASLPIVIAVFAVGTAIGLTVLASHVATVADFTAAADDAGRPRRRHRLRAAGLLPLPGRADRRRGPRDRAVGKALDTAGRTVFFAGCTVIVALLGLVVLGLGSLQGVAVAVALTVLVTMVAALTLLPALLAVFGGRIERGGAPARRAAAGEGPRDRRRPVAAVVGRRAAPAVAGRPAAGRRRCSRSAAPALGHAAGLRRRRQRRAGQDQPAGVRPAGRRASGRASTARWSSWSWTAVAGGRRGRAARARRHAGRRGGHAAAAVAGRRR